MTEHTTKEDSMATKTMGELLRLATDEVVWSKEVN